MDIKIANKRFPVTANDLLVRCTEESFQKLSIQSAGPSILYSEDLDEDTKKKLITAAKAVQEKIERMIAKKLTDMQLREGIGDVSVPELPSGAASEVNFDDMISALPSASDVKPEA